MKTGEVKLYIFNDVAMVISTLGSVQIRTYFEMDNYRENAAMGEREIKREACGGSAIAYFDSVRA